MKKLMLLKTIFLLLTSCNKKYHVIGRVYNPVTKEGIPNIEIRLLKDEEVPSLSGGSEAVKTIYTDANGYYELDHASIGSRYVGCFLDNDQYYRIGWIYEGENIGKHTTFVNKGKYTYLDYQVVTYGQLKVNIHNISCEGAGDQLKLERIYEYDDTYNSIYQPIYLTGCYNQDGVAAKVPMGTYEIKWTVTRTSGTTVFSDQVFVPKTGLGEYTINY